MVKQNLPVLSEVIEKKYRRKDDKKKKKMKVSGAGVKNLQKLIREKSPN